MDYVELQKQHRAWLDIEYPQQPPTIPAAGLIEEAGELLHCLIKMEHERLWGPDHRYISLHSDLEDAIGDCAIYACSLCNALGWSFSSIADLSKTPAQVRDAMPLAVQLVKDAAAMCELPYCPSRLSMWLTVLRLIADASEIDFDAAVQCTWQRVRMRHRRSTSRPTIVCLCGSTRFKQEFFTANFRETMRGRIVLSVGFFSHADEHRVSEEEKAALDELHKRKIDIADEVLVLDCPVQWCDECAANVLGAHRHETRSIPYIGSSTSSEIAYAEALGKRVRYLSQEGEK